MMTAPMWGTSRTCRGFSSGVVDDCEEGEAVCGSPSPREQPARKQARTADKAIEKKRGSLDSR